MFSPSTGVTGYAPFGAAENGLFNDYKWIVVMGCFGALYTAWGIGANDMANSFGTTVGSKTLKIWQVVIIASIFEFLGAFFLGATVTDTISTKIVRASSFANRPELYMYGMMIVDYSSALWINIATALELPISTTHSTIGAVVGFGLANSGRQGIIWNDKIDTFPYRSGITTIVISWFTSPIIAAVFSACLFLIIRTCILRRFHSFKIACFLVPVILFAVVMVNVVFVISKGAKFVIDQDNRPLKATCAADINARTIHIKYVYGYAFAANCITEEKTKRQFFPTPAAFGPAGAVLPADVTAQGIYEDYTIAYPKAATGYCCRKVNIFSVGGWTSAAGPAALAASIAMIFFYVYIFAYVQPKITKHFAELEEKDRIKRIGLQAPIVKTDSDYADAIGKPIRKFDADVDTVVEEPLPSIRDLKNFWRVASKMAVRKVFAGAFYNIHEITENEKHVDFDPRAKHMHEVLERFNPATEMLFEYLQIISACALSFAHGANDVANAVGPFTGVWSVYKFRRINPASLNFGNDVRWILAIGGIGIIIGLATYGHYIVRALGVKLASITPSRGFVMETCTGVTVTFASAYGLPVSTTHCQVGSTSGTGFVDSPRYGVNWPFLGRMCVGWAVTLICAGIFSAALFSQGVYAPNTYMAKDRESYQKFIGAAVRTLLTQANATSPSAAQLAAAGYADEAAWRAQLATAFATNDKLNFERIASIDKYTRKVTYSLDAAKQFRYVQYFYAADQNVVLEQAVAALKPLMH